MPTYECPTCHRKIDCARPDEAPFRPFCSERCKLLDLGKWLNEEYRVTEEVPDELQAENDDTPPPKDEA
jgi:endogenous inhibitor of DNA gyrase (YacG/DUF329 family)